jgi:hypothetical protein
VVKFVLMLRVDLHHHDQDSATNVLGGICVLGYWHEKPSAPECVIAWLCLEEPEPVEAVVEDKNDLYGI